MRREIRTTIQLDGERQFKQSLADAGRQLRVLGSEMRANTAAFANNADSMEALTSRGQIYERQVSQQREVVTALSRAVEESAQAYGEADRRTDDYRIQLNNATAALSRMENELQQNNRAIENFGQEAAQTTSRLDRLRESARRVGESLKGTGDKIKGAGEKMSVGITAPILAIAALATEGTKELRGDLAKLATNAQVAGQDMGLLNDAMAKLQAVTGETDSNVEGLSELLATGFRGEQLSELLNSLYGASIKFSDTMKFEGIADGLQETLATGQSIGPFDELLSRSGVNLDNFNAGLKEAIANGTENNYVLDVLAKTGLAQTYEAYRKNNEEMVKAEEANYRMQEAMANLGATLEPILTPIIEKITELVNKFNEMDPATQKTILAIAGIAAAAGPLLVVTGTVIGLFGSLTLAAGGLGIGVGALVGIIGGVIAVVAAVIAIGVLLWKNWDTLEIKVGEISASVDAKFEAIRASVSNKINSAKDAVGNAIEKMKGFFDFSWSLPKIKLPHFNIQGKFSLNPPQIPTFGVSWWDKGGIFNSPSIIGVGEKRPEFVGALDDLRKIFREESGRNSKQVMAGPLLQVENLVINNDMDIQEVANKLGFYWQQTAAAKGG